MSKRFTIEVDENRNVHILDDGVDRGLYRICDLLNIFYGENNDLKKEIGELKDGMFSEKDFSDYFGDGVFVDEDFLITTRKPCRTDFTHSECSYCEETCFNGVKRLYCNYWEDIILKRDIYSCENFKHNDKDICYGVIFDDLEY